MKINTIFIVAVFLAVGCGNRDNGTVIAQSKAPVSEKESTESEEGMVLIKGGTFTSVIGQETLKVAIKPFLMDKYEVTIAEFEKFVRESGYVPKTDRPGAKTLILKSPKQVEVSGVNWRYDERGNKRDSSAYNFPVVHVSYEDAEAYAKWAGKRLPTIYEWQYAAIGEIEEPDLLSYISTEAWDQSNTRKIQLGGTKAPNQFGLFDLIGNVSEHVALGTHKTTVPPGRNPESISRASFSSFFQDEENLYPVYFSHSHVRGTSFDTGFRCAKDLSN